MSASITYKDFALEAIRGKTNRFDLAVTVRDADGVLQPAATIAGWKLFFTAKERVGDADAAAALRFNTTDDPDQLEVTDADARTARLTLQPAQFADLSVRAYTLWCDVQGIPPSGDVVTLCRGKLYLAPEVTRVNT